jgi:hypothetical protein
MSLYFFVGYLTSFWAVMLSVGIRTQFYAQLSEAVQKAPVVSLLIAAPFVVILGIFVNMFRLAIIRVIIKRHTYNFSAVPEILKETLKLTIATQLSIDQDQVNLQNDRHFEITKLLLLPEMNEYAIPARWLHDLFENVVVVMTFSLIILAFRAKVFGLEMIDWALILGSFFAVFIAVFSLHYLRRNYTTSEVSVVVKNHKLQQLQRLPETDADQIERT